MNTIKTSALAEALVDVGYHVIDNFLSHHHHQALRTQIKALAKNQAFRPAKVGQSANTAHQPTIRTDHLCWVNESMHSTGLFAFHNAIDDLKQALNRTLFLGLEQFEAHFAIYRPGQFYKKHIDQFKNNQDRKISCVYYLNETWQPSYGGELCIYNTAQQPIIRITPFGNRLVYFDSTLLHEVLPTEHMRYSITGWLKSRPASLI